MARGDDVPKKPKGRQSHHVVYEVPARTIEAPREGYRSDAIIAARRAIGVPPDDYKGEITVARTAADPAVEELYNRVLNEVENSPKSRNV